jgi:hypothetical protein
MDEPTLQGRHCKCLLRCGGSRQSVNSRVESCAAGFGFQVGLYCGGGRTFLEGDFAMVVSELEQKLEDRDYRVQRLRIETLRRMGYGVRTAILLAVHGDLDFALAEKLRTLGCPEETALRILL